MPDERKRPRFIKHLFFPLAERPKSLAKLGSLQNLLEKRIVFNNTAYRGIVPDMRTVMTLRRKLTYQLNKVDDIGYVRPSIRLQMNCPPLGDTNNQPIQPCRRILTCPFCWTRMVVTQAYFKFSWLLFGEPDTPADTVVQRTRDCSLYTFHKRSFIDKLDAATISGVLQEQREAALAMIEDPRLNSISFGTFGLVTVEPFPKLPKLFDFNSRIMTCVLKDQLDAESLAQEYGFSYSKLPGKKITPTRLAKAVAETAPFPAQMVLGDPQSIMTVLSSRQNMAKTKAPKLQIWRGFVRQYDSIWPLEQQNIRHALMEEELDRISGVNSDEQRFEDTSDSATDEVA